MTFNLASAKDSTKEGHENVDEMMRIVDVIIPRFGIPSVHRPPPIPIDSRKPIDARHRRVNDFVRRSRCSLPLGSSLLTSNISS
jgi:hypothetical protein